MSRWADVALAEWRSYREPADTDKSVSRAGGALRGLLAKLGLEDALDTNEVRAAWDGLVGEFIASKTVPEKISSRVLYVRVYQSSVRFELERMWKGKVVEKLTARFGTNKICDVKFVS